ncbi:MAG TPA: HYR domain-containing protein, partial [Acidimicrobiales bacterium]|nr:HYR domain-containing protein [Acidimicrobiales bacterium]
GRMNQVPCTPPSGSTFPLGGTKVECVATDRAGNTGRDAFAIMVVDTTPPAITVPADRVVEATGPGGAAVTYTATATDIVDGSVTPACDIASGATLALGEHTISCSAVDRAGNPATGRSFAVTVVDTTGPALTVPANQIVEATSSEGAVVTYAASAADLVDGAVAVQCSLASGATFPLGTWTVVCTASDSRGNAASRSFGVTIRDTTPPKLNTPSDITVMATSAAGATVTYQATATDDVDDGVQASCSPASGSTFAAGATTVTCNASDRYGNAATPKTFKVTVRFDFDGFFAPVDTNKVLNGMKAGSTVPMKFSISNQSGGHISDLGIVKVAAPAAVSCTTGTLYDEVTEYASGASAVKYDATANQYVYNWQSPKKPGSCYQVTILVGGAPQSAIFQLR